LSKALRLTAHVVVTGTIVLLVAIGKRIRHRSRSRLPRRCRGRRCARNKSIE
jgi:hypothetical protein